MLFVVLCLGAPEGSTGSGTGLKGLGRRGHSLKSHSKDWESRGSKSGPLCSRQVTYPLHHGGPQAIHFM